MGKEQPSVQSVCASCRFAEWKRTANGRRHPDGSGRCAFPFPNTPLPKCINEHAYGRDKGRLRTVAEYMEQRHGGRFIWWLEFHSTIPMPCEAWSAK